MFFTPGGIWSPSAVLLIVLIIRFRIDDDKVNSVKAGNYYLQVGSYSPQVSVNSAVSWAKPKHARSHLARFVLVFSFAFGRT